jgi:hypothetical protein
VGRYATTSSERPAASSHLPSAVAWTRVAAPEALLRRAKMWILRKLLHPVDELAAIEFLLDKMKDTKTNSEFFAAMKR